MTCAICRTRRPRRFCPGVRGEICSICCGKEREVTVNCPFECPFLQQAREHDRPVAIDPEQIPNRDIEVKERFLVEHDSLVAFVGATLVRAALETPGAVDFDVREAVGGLVRTYRTLEKGVYYESVPQNALAANIFRLVQRYLGEFRQEETQRTGMSQTRDSDVMRALVFFERVELDRNNGRTRGRAFVNTLLDVYGSGPGPEPSPTSSLILP
jgi:hypothetical protein